MAVGVFLLAVFVRHALRVPEPLLDLRLLRDRGFATGAAANLMVGIALFGGLLLLPLLLDRARPEPL